MFIRELMKDRGTDIYTMYLVFIASSKISLVPVAAGQSNRHASWSIAILTGALELTGDITYAFQGFETESKGFGHGMRCLGFCAFSKMRVEPRHDPNI
jgi:hypothetical protein